MVKSFFSSRSPPKFRRSSCVTLDGKVPPAAPRLNSLSSLPLKFMADFEGVIFDLTAVTPEPRVFSNVLKKDESK